MAGLVTQETNRSVQHFIDSLGSMSKKKDSLIIIDLMRKISGYEPKIWGNEKNPDFLIGFGKYSYSRKGSNQTYEWFNIGFAPRKSKLTIYLTYDVSKEEKLLKSLGKCTWGKGCLYIKQLADINLEILESLIEVGTRGKTND